jgi:hypothetical protein
VLTSWEIKNPIYAAGSGYTDDQPRCTFTKAWKKKNARLSTESGRAIALGFAEHNDTWALDTVNNPVHLLGAITYLEDALQCPIQYSAQSTGKRLMKETNVKGERAEWVRPVNLAPFRDTPIVTNKVVDVLWKCELSEQERGEGMFLIAPDKNSEYPAGCTGVLLGEGEPNYIERPVFDMKKSLAGVYSCSISGTSDFDGIQLPHPTNGVTNGYFWTYTVKLLHELGYTIEIKDAYVWNWEKSHTILRPWVEHVWSARERLDSNNPRCDTIAYPSQDARKFAYGAVKPVLNSSLGLLDHPPDYDTEDSRAWYRPDWYQLIKDYARYQMFWRIRTMLKNCGLRPVGVLADCLYYACTSDDHIQALPKMFDRWDKLGGYKRKFKKTIASAQYIPLFDQYEDIREINNVLLAYERGTVSL